MFFPDFLAAGKIDPVLFQFIICRPDELFFKTAERGRNILGTKKVDGLRIPFDSENGASFLVDPSAPAFFR